MANTTDTTDAAVQAALDTAPVRLAIFALAQECAAEAARQGSPARSRGLRDDEDAGQGDYDALDEALGREATGDERLTFRRAFSAALADDPINRLTVPEATIPSDMA